MTMTHLRSSTLAIPEALREHTSSLAALRLDESFARAIEGRRPKRSRARRRGVRRTTRETSILVVPSAETRKYPS